MGELQHVLSYLFQTCLCTKQSYELKGSHKQQLACSTSISVASIHLQNKNKHCSIQLTLSLCLSHAHTSMDTWRHRQRGSGGNVDLRFHVFHCSQAWKSESLPHFTVKSYFCIHSSSACVFSLSLMDHMSKIT